MSLNSTYLGIASLILLAHGLWRLLRRNDELPLAIAGFNFLFLTRLWAIQGGLTDWVQFDYGIDFSFTDYPSEAATYMLLGAALLIGTYCRFWKPQPEGPVDSDAILSRYLLEQRTKMLGGFALFALANALLPLWFEDSGEYLYGSSYLYQFSLAYSGFIVLIATLVVYAERSSIGQKVALLGTVAIAGALTIAPTLRFAFLGWAIPLGFVFTGALRPARKLLALVVVGVAVAAVFSISGVMRDPDMRHADDAQVLQESAESLVVGRDINMVDGFAMLMQVYPDILDYGLGRDHLEILARPIPRFLWPDKPVGGWSQKIAASRGMEFFSTGISPSLYGSFYAEGGVIGVALFSLLYGWLFARYVNRANRHASSMRWVLRGTLIASLFALIRGGDIPGIASFIGMSYWPLFLFCFGYYRTLRRRKIYRTPPETASDADGMRSGRA